MAVTGRPRAFDREVALNAAMLVFWRKGFNATSMADLCDAMGIRSPSLYAAFYSKEALYIEAIERYARTVGSSVWNSLNEGATARAGVERLLRAATTAPPEYGVPPSGCMMALAAVGEECSAAIQRSLKGIRSECLDQLRSRLRKARTAGELPAGADADRLARFYMSVYLGMASQARDGATAAELEGVTLAAMMAWPERTGKGQATHRP